MKKKVVWLVVSCLMVLSLVLTSCAQAVTEEEEEEVGPTGKVTIAIMSLGGQHLDPHEYTGGIEAIHLVPMFEALMARNLEGGLDHDWSIATAVEIIDNGLGYRFHLRQGVKFHNGEALTAEDVKFSFERQVRPESKGAGANWLRPRFDRAVVEDDYTVVVYLKEPNSVAIERLSVYIVPKDYIEEVGDDEFAKHPVGSGPFKFVAQQPDDFIELEAYTDYWRDVPTVKTVMIRIIPEMTTRLAMLKTGEVDIAGGVTPALLPEVEAYPGLRVIRVEGASKMWAWFTGAIKAEDGAHVANEASPLLNKKVRQALNYAIDKETITQTLYNDEATPMVTLGDRSVFGSDLTLEPYPYDPDKARQLLAEAGYPDGFALNIYTSPHSAITGTLEMAEILAAYFDDIGITSTITKLDYGTLLTDMVSRKLDGVTLIATTTQYPTYTPLLYYSYTGPWSMIIDPVFDAVIEQIEAATTAEEQERFTKQADRMSYEDAHHLFLVYGNALYGASDRIASWSQIAANGYVNRLEFLRLKE